MGNSLDSEDAFAFAIDLHGKLAIVNFEYRHIIGRSLEHDLESFLFIALVSVGTVLVAKNGLQLMYVKRGATLIYYGIEDLIKDPASLKKEIAAVLNLVYRVGISKAAPLLFIYR